MSDTKIVIHGYNAAGLTYVPFTTTTAGKLETQANFTPALTFNNSLKVHLTGTDDSVSVQIAGADGILNVSTAYTASPQSPTRGGVRTTAFNSGEKSLAGGSGRGLRVIINTIAITGGQTLTVLIEFSYFDPIAGTVFYSEYTTLTAITAVGVKRIVIAQGIPAVNSAGYESFPDIMAGSCRVTVTPSNGALTYNSDIHIEQM